MENSGKSDRAAQRPAPARTGETPDADGEAPARLVARISADLGRLVDSGSGTEAGRLLVAFSGGLDSSVLLHALARLAPARPIEAIHIDHGWHPDSADWSAHCAGAAAALGLPCTIRRVDAAAVAGRSAEAVAREARYAAFAELVGAGDVLLTAHHADDQLETLLLRLLRGTGVRGLRAIHAEAPLGSGRLIRPLLGYSRRELEQLADAWQVEYLRDPANTALAFDRNYLRARVVPLLRARWPAAEKVAARVAGHMRDAEQLLAALAEIDGGATAEPDRVPLAPLGVLAPARRANLLRHLIARCGLAMPDERQLAELLRQLDTVPGTGIHVAWRGGEARTFRGHLYLQIPLAAAPRPGPAGTLDPATPWQGPEGRLRLVPASAGGIPDALVARGLRVEFRRGGERFVPAGGVRHQTLKHWFQDASIVPWMRGRVPLVYCNDELIAIADLALAALPVSDRTPGWRPVWDRAQRLR